MSTTSSWTFDVVDGEFWLVDGTALGADGDVGDRNHDSWAVEHFQHNAADLIRAMGRPWSDDLARVVEGCASRWEGDTTALREAIHDHTDRLVGTPLYDNWSDELLRLCPEARRDELRAAWDSDCDARGLAIRKLGWVRLAGTRIELWRLADSLPTLADGLFAAHDELAEQETWAIEERSTGRLWRDVPWRVLDEQDLHWFWRELRQETI